MNRHFIEEPLMRLGAKIVREAPAAQPWQGFRGVPHLEINRETGQMRYVPPEPAPRVPRVKRVRPNPTPGAPQLQSSAPCRQEGLHANPDPFDAARYSLNPAEAPEQPRPPIWFFDPNAESPQGSRSQFYRDLPKGWSHLLSWSQILRISRFKNLPAPLTRYPQLNQGDAENILGRCLAHRTSFAVSLNADDTFTITTEF